MKLHPLLLRNKIQHYSWGSKGQTAYIPNLLGLKDYSLEKPFAELWIGTHPSGPSALVYEGSECLLSDLIARFPAEILGERVAGTYANGLPFLLKVLSAGRALSIQLHPSKSQARALHQKDPKNYPDQNHKPEIAVAIDELVLLAGIRDAKNVKRTLAAYPELADFIAPGMSGEQNAGTFALKAFSALFMRATQVNSAEITDVIDAIKRRILTGKQKTSRQKLFLDLCSEYPGDIGLLCVFFLKLFRLQKGEAIYIPHGIPHAYIRGNLVECMATSDNVIRAGLTEKYKDIPALLECVTAASPLVFPVQGQSQVYRTPADEFRVSRFNLEPGARLEGVDDGVRILLLLSGQVQMEEVLASRGQAWLVPASVNLSLAAVEKSELYLVRVP